MADYPLTQLGPTEFEHMSQSLLAALVGPVNVKVYGAGRDGGRELTTTAIFELEDDLQWSGYTVAQAKFHARPGPPAVNATWLRNQIRAELRDWTDPEKVRHPKPDNLLFISNVQVSAVPGHGLDFVEDVFAEFADALPLNAYAIWHYDHVCRLLDSQPGVREAYAGLLTVGDVLTQLHQHVRGDVVDIGEVLRRHAVKELVAEQWVRLGESGSRTNEKLQIGQVGVDLQAIPAVAHDAASDPKPVNVLQHLIAIGDGVLRHTIREGPEPYCVLVGGPGQGKTTVGQLLCQIYRASLIEDLDSVGQHAATAITTLRHHLAASGLPGPVNKRWPLRIDLSRYADVLGGAPDTSVLRYLASQISDRGAETITAAQLKTWLKWWPWMLVLDGFDEVVARQVREAMVARIADFFIDAAGVDADLMVIATTRPQGYSAEFSPDQYQHLHLTPLTSKQAEAFAQKLADVRLADDPSKHADVLDRISEAVENPLTAHLMVTPLQVTILSLLLEARPRVPEDRYTLFAEYYRTIYSREVAKQNATARLLEQHHRTIDQLHEEVGLRLQIQAETHFNAEAALPSNELQALAAEILNREDHPAEDAQRLAEQIAAAARVRLVLLVPKHSDDVGFDVRSLQELMAARALTTGRDGQIMTRLREIALSAHWRNTFLFAAGRVAADRNHLVNDILNLLADLDTSSYLTMYLRPAAGLALDLLDDKFAAPSPRVEMNLARAAIGVLQSPPTVGALDAADILQRASLTGSTLLGPFIADAARTSLEAVAPQRITAAIMMRRWTQGTGTLAALGRQRTAGDHAELGSDHADALGEHYLTRSLIARPKVGSAPSGKAGAAKATSPRHPTIAGYLGTTARNDLNALHGDDSRAWDELLRSLNRISVTAVGSKPIPVIEHLSSNHKAVTGALARPAVANHLADRLLALDQDDWAIASAVADIVTRVSQRWTVGPLLLEVSD